MTKNIWRNKMDSDSPLLNLIETINDNLKKIVELEEEE